MYVCDIYYIYNIIYTCITYIIYIKLAFTFEVKFRIFTALDLHESSKDYLVTKVYLLSYLQVLLIYTTDTTAQQLFKRKQMHSSFSIAGLHK